MKEPVFICYRREESGDFVDHLVKKMENRFEVSWDKNIGPVPDVEAEIFRRIDRCSYFIIVLHKDTLDFSTESKRDDNKWIIKELSHVLENIQKGFSTKIIPVLKEDSTSTIIIKKPLAPNDINNEEDRELIAKFKIMKDFPSANGIKTNGERLDVFYPKLLKFMGANNFFERNKLKLFILGAILLVIAGVSELIYGTYLYNQRGNMKNEMCIHNQKDTTLIFAGGGSVANMIKDLTMDSVNVKKYNNSLYLDLPSKSAWDLLSEEVLLNHTSESFENKFYPICLSALNYEDESSAFLKHCSREDLVKKGTIVSYLLGYDTLKVYFNYNVLTKDENCITIDELSKELYRAKNEGKAIFCTQEGSGTYYQYKKILLGKIDLTKESLGDSILRYYNETSSESGHFNDTRNKDNTERYIVLSSSYYTPSVFKNNHEKGFNVVASNGVVSKPMYLFFAAYLIYPDTDSSSVKIPDLMVQFLKNIVKHNKSFMNDVNYIKPQMYYAKKRVVTQLRDLIDMQKKQSN